MRLVVVLGVVVLAVGVLAGPAQAGGSLTRLDTDLPPWGANLGGPAFAGDGLSWVTVGRDTYNVMVARDGVIRQVDEIDAVPHGQRFMSLAASAQRIAFGVFVEDCHDYSECKYGYYTQDESRVYAGPIGGPLSYVGCTYYEDAAVDVSGDAVVYVDSCAGGATVRDLSPGANGSWRTFQTVWDARIAGSYLAVALRSGEELPNDVYPMELRIYDWRSGALVYKVDAPTRLRPHFDIQEDGTLVYDRVTGTGETDLEELDWASPESPSPHRLRDGSFELIRVADDRIATREGFDTHVIDLAGTEVAVTKDIGAFDFDGRRLTWATQPCELTAIVTWDLRGKPPALPAAPCPLAIPGRHLVAKLKRQRLRLAFKCPKRPALGCAGSASITLPNRAHSFKSISYLLGPGESGSFRSDRLSRATACGVARARGKADVSLHVEASRWENAPTRHLKLDVKRVGKPRGCTRPRRFP
jgi:hypothetical protein